MAAGSGREANYWPGFVDALTNTVIAMVFLVIVLTLSLSVFINAIANQRAAKIVQNQMDRTKDPSSVSAADGLPPDVKQNSPAPAGSFSTKTAPSLLRGDFRVAESKNAPPDSSSASKEASGISSIVLRFPGSVVDIDEKTTSEIEKLMSGSGISFEKMQANIVARGPQIFLSENQRLAFFRAMAVRNMLMKKGIHRDRITIRIEDAPGASEGVLSISIRREDSP